MAATGELISDEELLRRLPRTRIDHDNKVFYKSWLERRLLLNRCCACGSWHHPPVPMCPSCWAWNVVATEVSGRGTIHLLTWLRQGPAVDGVDYAAGYPVATVELDEQPGLRFTSTVIGAPPGELRIGQRVDLAWIEREGAPFPVFRPSETP
jgi:uncharacterized protein